MSRVMVTRKRYEGIGRSSNYAVGDESNEIRRQFAQFWGALHNVISVQPRILAIRHLTELYRQCSQENWDGEEAMAISEQTYQEGLKFLGALPLSIKVPELVAEPNGAIGFEWRRGPNAIFVASVMGIQKISFAGLFGPGARAHGTEDFVDSIPGTIIANLQRLSEIE